MYLIYYLSLIYNNYMLNNIIESVLNINEELLSDNNIDFNI